MSGPTTATNCSRCGTLPDDILVLTCDHNLCLPCSAANLHRQELKGQHTFQTVVCDICQIATVLDPSSASELLSMFPQQPNLNDTPPMRHITPPPPQPHPMQPKPSLNMQNLSGGPSGADYSRSEAGRPIQFSMQSQGGNYCKEHDQPICYFCFDCMCEPICPECVVHGKKKIILGSHRNHSVQTVRKAYPSIKQKIEEMVHTLSSHISSLNEHQNILNKKKQEVQQVTIQSQNLVRQNFQEIISSIENKEKELLAGLDRFCQDTQRQYESYIRIVNGKAENIAATCDFVMEQLQKQDEVNQSQRQIGVLQFYALNHNKIMSSMHTDIPQIKSVPELLDIKYNLNPGRVNQLIQQLKGIDIEVQRMSEASSNTQFNQSYGAYVNDENSKGHMNHPLPIGDLEKRTAPLLNSKFHGLEQSKGIFEYAYKGNVTEEQQHGTERDSARGDDSKKQKSRGATTSKFLGNDRGKGNIYYRKLHQG